MKFLLAFLLIVILPVAAYADESEGVTVRSYRTFILDPTTRVPAQYFVMGIGLGYVFGSALGQTQLGNKPFVCPQKNLPISGTLVLNIFDNFIKTLPSQLEDRTIAVIMPFALQNALPCE